MDPIACFLFSKDQQPVYILHFNLIRTYSILNLTLLEKKVLSNLRICTISKNSCLALINTYYQDVTVLWFMSFLVRAAHRGGQLGHFAPGPSLKGAPGGPMKGPLNTCLKDRYTLIEQSDLNTVIKQSQYSSEEQCSKLIDKEIWLMGSYCHCQQVATFFFFFFFFFLVFTLQLG